MEDNAGRPDPLVTIITPTFNRAYILGEAIRSVLAQTHPHWEQIIVDDGSTDDTTALVRSFHDSRIRYLHQPNQGPSVARNRALAIARGEWIAYIDSDNVLFPNYLDVMLRHLTRSAGLVFAIARGKRTHELYRDGRLIDYVDNSDDFPPELTARDIGLRSHHFDLNGFMHARTVIESGIRFDEEMHSMEDWDFAISIAERFPEGFVYVKELLFHYHQRFGTDGLVSNSTYGDWADAFERIYQKHKRDHILEGQTWYPQRVEKYSRMQREYEAGKLPPQYLSLFSQADRR